MAAGSRNRAGCLPYIYSTDTRTKKRFDMPLKGENSMTDAEREVVEGVLDSALPEDGFYEDLGNRYVISDGETYRTITVNVAAVRKFCTLDELADYVQVTITEFYNRLSETS